LPKQSGILQTIAHKNVVGDSAAMGQNIKCRHSTVSLENAVLFFTFFTVASYSCKVYGFYKLSNGTGGSILAYGVADPCSILY
jgi:Holliday junction resolvasome RuvABC DNA-binding subunit